MQVILIYSQVSFISCLEVIIALAKAGGDAKIFFDVRPNVIQISVPIAFAHVNVWIDEFGYLDKDEADEARAQSLQRTVR